MIIILAVPLFLFSLVTHASDYQRVTPVLLYGNFEKLNRTINLASSISDQFEIDPAPQNWQTQTTQKAYLSAGAAFEFSQGSAWQTLGIFPFFDSYMTSFRENSSLPYASLSVPRTPEELSKWNTKDTLFYKTQGGIGVYGFIGTIFNGIGPRVQISGDFRVYFEKKNDNELYVEIKTDRIYDLSIIAGNFISYAEISKSIEYTKRGFAFQINLATAQGKKAISSILKGKIAEVYDELMNNPNQDNYYVADISESKTQNSRKIGLTTPIIPILSLSHSKTTSQWNQSRIQSNGQVIERNEYSVIKLTNGRALKYQRNSVDIISFILDQNKDLISIEADTFFEATQASEKKLYLAVERFKKEIGDHKLLEVNFPEPSNKQKLSYGIAKLSISLPLNQLKSETILGKLIAEYQDKKNESTLRGIAKLFFNNPKNTKDILSYNSSCDGKIKLEIAGEKIKRLQRETDNCSF